MAVKPKFSADVMIPRTHNKVMAETTDRVVAIGTSTGGTQALERVLTCLPRTVPGIIVVQYMPELFTSAQEEKRLHSLWHAQEGCEIGGCRLRSTV